MDLGILRLTDEVWTSDNTDPFDRLSIQDGFSYAYTPGIMMAWVTDSPNWVNQRSTSLEYRFLSSMQGSLGIGADLTRWSDQDFEAANGRQVVLFAFLHSSSMLYPYPGIHLKGLDSQARYRLRVLAGKALDSTPVVASGAYWMSEGIEPLLKGDFQAATFVLDRE